MDIDIWSQRLIDLIDLIDGLQLNAKVEIGGCEWVWLSIKWETTEQISSTMKAAMLLVILSVACELKYEFLCFLSFYYDYLKWFYWATF